MRKAYIAGPMRGYDLFNFPAFDAAKLKLLDEEEYHVVSPADIDRMFEDWPKGEMDHEGHYPTQYPPEDFVPTIEDFKRFIRRDLNFLLELSPENGDAIYLLKNWEQSKGARVELALAEFLGLKVLYEDDLS